MENKEERKIAMHNRTLSRSKPLQAAYDLLSDGEYHTTAEIAKATGSVCAGTLLSELRHDGIEISSADFVGTNEQGAKVYRYRMERKTVRRDIRQAPPCPACGCGYRDHDTGRCKDCGEYQSVPKSYYSDVA